MKKLAIKQKKLNQGRRNSHRFLTRHVGLECVLVTYERINGPPTPKGQTISATGKKRRPSKKMVTSAKLPLKEFNPH